MKLIRHSQWTNLERLELLKVCSDETIEKDWGKRADVMSRRYASVGIFFTAKVLHSEFERILAAPCPGIELNMSGQYSYSHKVLIEKWIAHFTRVIDEESSKKSELAMVEIRRCTSLIEKLLADKMSLDEMADLLEKLKMENPKKEDDMQFKRVVSTYSNRLLHVWKTSGSTIINLPAQLPPTMMAAPGTSGEDGAGFMTPTYQSTSTTSAISSPIRSVAEALKDAVPIFAEPIPPPIKEPPTNLEEPKREEDEEEIKMEEDDGDDEEEETLQAPDTPKQKGRPRGPLAKLTPKEKKERSESAELRRSGDSSSSLADSVALPAPVKKPRLGTPAGRRRNKDAAASAAAAAAADADDKKSVRSVDSFEIPSAPLTPMPAEWRDIECQTEVSIRGCPRVAASPERGSGPGRRSAAATTPSAAAAATTPLRKSSRRTEKQATPVAPATPTASLNTSGASDRVCHVACQTGRVEFDKEDIVTLFFAATQDEMEVAETVVLDKGRKAAGKQRQGDETMMEISNERGGAEDDAEETPTHRRGSKSEAKREMTYAVETQTNIAQKLIDEKGFKIMRISDAPASGPPSPTKRGSGGAAASASRQKDASSRDEATNTRFQMNSMWRILSDHKNSGIFSHPVTENNAPGYNATIKRRVDLATLKKEIDAGVVASKNAFMLKTYTMFANAVMFNSTGHDVNTYAKTMARDVMNDIAAVTSHDERKSGIASRRSKIVDDARSSQRAQSVEPEIVPLLGVPGATRRVFKRKCAQKQSNQIKKTNQK